MANSKRYFWATILILTAIFIAVNYWELRINWLRLRDSRNFWREDSLSRRRDERHGEPRE